MKRPTKEDHRFRFHTMPKGSFLIPEKYIEGLEKYIDYLESNSQDNHCSCAANYGTVNHEFTGVEYCINCMRDIKKKS